MKKIVSILSLALCAVVANASDWKPAGDLIKTQWAEQVNPSAPLPEYPRPQMVRSN